MMKPSGEFVLRLGNDEYKACYSINAICDLEEVTGKSIAEISKQMGDPKRLTVTFVRAFLWAGLRKHHPNITLQASGELIGQHGLDAIMDQLIAGFVSAFPQPEPGKADRPMTERKHQDGNGINSSSTGSNAA